MFARPSQLLQRLVFGFFLLCAQQSFSMNLAVGDLVTINVDLDYGEFRLMALANIPSGTVIRITDRGLDNSGNFTAEGIRQGTIVWTVGTAISAGETFIFNIDIGTPPTVSLIEVADNIDRSGELSSTGWPAFVFNTGGDQVIVYQGTDMSPTFISGFHNSTLDSGHSAGNVWTDVGNPIDDRYSYLPTGLSNNVNALAFSDGTTTDTNHVDNMAYNGPTTAADKATWLTRIFNRTNWIKDSAADQVGSISETPGDAAGAPSVVTNTAPVLGGTPADDTATEDVATAIDLSAYNVSDADGDTITLRLAVDRGTIASIDGNGTTAGVTISNSGTALINLQGTAANLNTYLDDTSKITFTTAHDDTTTAVITVTPNDGTEDGSADTVNITISAVNDLPTVSTLAASATVTEDTLSNIDLSSASFADVDSASITVTFTASAGTFAMPADGAGVGGGVVENLVSATVIYLVGAPADINTYLDTASNILYTGAMNVSGNAAATITVTGNDGSGDVNLGTVNINITAVNDDPSATGIPAAVTVSEDTLSNIDLSAMVLGDVDSASITTVLTVSAGTFALPADGAGVGGGVVETLVSATVISLVGAPADINTYLDTASNIQYTGAMNASGNAAATITVTGNDGDGSGNVALGTVNINITEANDNPTVSGLPASVTVTEDIQSNIDLSAASFADLDGDNITVSLSVGAGTFSMPADGAGTGGGVVESRPGNTLITLVGAAADINTYLDTASNIRYTGAPNVNGNGATSITVTANDGAGSGDLNLGTVSVNITAVVDVPEFANLNGDSFSYSEGDGAELIDRGTQLVFSHGDAPNFNGGNVRLSIVSGKDADEDVLSVRTTSGVGLSGMTAGSNVNVAATTIGTLANNIAAGNDFVVNLNSNADVATIQTLARELTYSNLDTDNPTTGSRTVRLTVNDGNGGDSANQDITITVQGINDLPVISDLNGDAFTYTEAAGAVLIDQGSPAVLSDPDATDFNGGNLTVSISSGEDAAEDRLSVNGTVALGGATAGSSVAVSGFIIGTLANNIAVGNDLVVNFNANASIARVQSLIRAVTYENIDTLNATTGARNIAYTVADGDGGSSATQNVTITVEPLNNPPVFANLDGDSLSYGEGAGALNIDTAAPLSLSDATSADFDGGTVNVNFQGASLAEDLLNFDTNIVLSGTAVGSSVSLGGVTIGTLANEIAAGNNLAVNLNANANAATVQSLLRAVSYNNSNTINPATANRILQISVNDGDGATSAVQTVTVAVNRVNDMPTVTGLVSSVIYDTAQASVVLAGLTTVSDPELNSNGNYDGATLRLARTTPVVTDTFVATGNLAPLNEAGAVNLSGTNLGTVSSNSNGVLLLVFNANANQASVNQVVQLLAYRNTSTSQPVDLVLSFSDGNSGAQGSGGALNAGGTVTVNPISSNLSTLSISPSTVVADGSATASITVQAKTASGVNKTVGGDTVVITASGSATVSSVTDNGNGSYTATVNSTLAAQIQISGTINGQALANTASVTFAAGAVDGANSGSKVEVTDGQADTDTANSGALRLSLLDSNNNPVPNVAVQFAVASGSASLSSASGVTDANGQFSTTVSNTVAELATFTAQYDSNGDSLVDSAINNGSPASILFSAGSVDAAHAGTAIVASDAVGSTDDANSAALQVTLVDSNGNPVSNVRVQFNVHSGSATLTNAMGVTDANGQFSTTVSNSVAELASFTAQYDSNGDNNVDTAVSNGSPAQIRFSAGGVAVSNSGTLLQVTDAMADVDTVGSGALRLQLLDANNNPVPNTAVRFLVISGSASLSSATGVTDSQGQFATTVSNTVAETASFSAQFDSDNDNVADTAIQNGVPAAIAFAHGAVSNSNIETKVMALDAEGDVDQAGSASVQMQLRDQHNNPVPGVAVAFESSSHNSRFANAGGQTDANGLFSTVISDTVVEQFEVSGRFDSSNNGSVDTLLTTKATISFTDNTAPAMPSTSLNIASDGRLSVSGKAEVKALISIVFPDSSVVSGNADDDGNYSASSALPQTSGRISVTAADASGNTSAAAILDFVDEQKPTPVVIGSQSEKPDGSTEVTGHAEIGSRVVAVDGQGNEIPCSPAVVPTSGQYQCVIPAGTVFDVDITATDAAGNKSPATTLQDTTAPPSPEVTGSPQIDAGVTTVRGSAQPGSRIVVQDMSGQPVAAQCSPEIIATNAQFSCSLPFSAGKELQLLAQDNSGNKSSAITISLDDGDGVAADIEQQVLSTVSDKTELARQMGLDNSSALSNSPNLVALLDKPKAGSNPAGVFLSSVSNGAEVCQFRSVQMIQEGDSVNPGFADKTSYTVADDPGFDYPFGMAAYGLVCNRDGAEPVLTLLFKGFAAAEYDGLAAADIVFRKFNSETGQYSMAKAETAQWLGGDSPSLDGQRVLKASFRLIDDGAGDEYRADGSSAGLIYDPVGPAIPIAGSVVASKTANRKQASVGDIIQYRVQLSNRTDDLIQGVRLVDTLPRGIKLLPQSARLLDASGQSSPIAVSNGEQPVFAALQIPPNQEVTVVYSTVVGSGTLAGSQINKAVARLANVNISNEATAAVEITADPIFDRSTVIGKVFMDDNGNGRQDAGEQGLAGARLATVAGEWITVDQHGRYHYAGVEVGGKARGKNFILKLDTASLPEGAIVISENPRVVRLTKGLMARVDFAVQMPRAEVLEIYVEAGVFLDGSRLSGQAEKLLDGIHRSLLSGHQSNIAVYIEVSDIEFKSLQALLLARLEQRLADEKSLLKRVLIKQKKPSQKQKKTSKAGAVVKKHIKTALQSLAALIISPAYADVASLAELCQAEGWCEVRQHQVDNSQSGRAALAGGSVWLSELPAQDRASLSVWAENYAQVSNGELLKPIEFYASSNFSEFISRWQIQIFSANDQRLQKPVAELSGKKLPLGLAIPWQEGIKPELLTEGLVYRLRVEDALGRVAQTGLGNIRLGQQVAEAITPAQGSVLQRAVEQSVGLEENSIKLAGSLVQLHGSGLPVGSVIALNGARYAVSADGSVLAQQQMSPGEHRLQLELRSNDGKLLGNTQLNKRIKGDYFFMVGLADINTGKNNVASKVELESSDSQYDESVFVDGRLAFFLKGKLKGKYLLTAQMDTGEAELKDIFSDLHRRDPRKLFKRIDPDRYYPVYGDDSTISRDVDTQGKFYVRLDWEQGQLLWGNYNSGFSGTELADFNRSLYGAKLDIRSAAKTDFGKEKSLLKAFVSEPDTAAARDEFEGTGGSLYYLRYQDVALGSAKLSIEVREPFSERVREKTDLQEGRDYSIDEFQGRILLHRPLSAYAAPAVLTVINEDEGLDGDQVVLVVDYEYIPSLAGSDKRLTGGVRAKHWFNDHIALGATAVQQQNGATDFRKKAVDLSMQAGHNTHLVIEYAESEAGQNIAFNRSLDGGLSFERQSMAAANSHGAGVSINAQLDFAELSDEAVDGQLNAWFRDLDADFDSQRYQNSSGAGQRSYGLETELELSDSISLGARYSSLERGSDELEKMGAQLNYQLDQQWRLSAEYLRKEERLASNRFDSDTAGIQLAYQYSEDLLLSAKAQTVFDADSRSDKNNDLVGMGLNYQLNQKLSLEGEYLWGDRSDAARGGISYQLDERNTVFSNYHLSGASDRGRSLTLGQRSKMSDRLNVYQEHRFDRKLHEQQRGQSYGFDYQLSEGWRIGADWLDGKVERNAQSYDRNAYSVFASYKAKDLNLSNKLEYRVDENASSRNKQWLSVNHLKYRLDQDMSLQAKLEYSQTDNGQNKTARFGEFDLGLAYRPVANNRLNLLAMYSYLYDLDPQFSNIKLGEQGALFDERSHVLALEGLYQLDDRWLLGGKLAWKKGEVRGGQDQGQFYGSSTRLVVANARYHLFNRWDALMEYRRLSVQQAKDHRQGYLFALERQLNQQIKLGVGYNFTDFNDDLTALDYQVGGWFINLVGKY